MRKRQGWDEECAQECDTLLDGHPPAGGGRWRLPWSPRKRKLAAVAFCVVLCPGFAMIYMQVHWALHVQNYSHLDSAPIRPPRNRLVEIVPGSTQLPLRSRLYDYEPYTEDGKGQSEADRIKLELEGILSGKIEDTL